MLSKRLFLNFFFCCGVRCKIGMCSRVVYRYRCEELRSLQNHRAVLSVAARSGPEAPEGCGVFASQAAAPAGGSGAAPPTAAALRTPGQTNWSRWLAGGVVFKQGEERRGLPEEFWRVELNTTQLPH